jgi:hypothetical protein
VAARGCAAAPHRLSTPAFLTCERKSVTRLSKSPPSDADVKSPSKALVNPKASIQTHHCGVFVAAQRLKSWRPQPALKSTLTDDESSASKVTQSVFQSLM